MLRTLGGNVVGTGVNLNPDFGYHQMNIFIEMVFRKSLHIWQVDDWTKKVNLYDLVGIVTESI